MPGTRRDIGLQVRGPASEDSRPGALLLGVRRVEQVVGRIEGETLLAGRSERFHQTTHRIVAVEARALAVVVDLREMACRVVAIAALDERRPRAQALRRACLEPARGIVFHVLRDAVGQPALYLAMQVVALELDQLLAVELDSMHMARAVHQPVDTMAVRAHRADARAILVIGVVPHIAAAPALPAALVMLAHQVAGAVEEVLDAAVAVLRIHQTPVGVVHEALFLIARHAPREREQVAARVVAETLDAAVREDVLCQVVMLVAIEPLLEAVRLDHAVRISVDVVVVASDLAQAVRDMHQADVRIPGEARLVAAVVRVLAHAACLRPGAVPFEVHAPAGAIGIARDQMVAIAVPGLKPKQKSGLRTLSRVTANCAHSFGGATTSRNTRDLLLQMRMPLGPCAQQYRAPRQKVTAYSESSCLRGSRPCVR